MRVPGSLRCQNGNHRLRPAMTLLEVVLAMALATMLTLAVYQTVAMVYLAEESGRDTVEQAQVQQGVRRQLRADLSAIYVNWQPDSATTTTDTSSSSASASGTSGSATASSGLTGSSGLSVSAGSATSGSMTSGGTSVTTSTATPSEDQPPPGGIVGSIDELIFVIRVPAEEAWKLVDAGESTAAFSDLRLVRYTIAGAATLSGINNASKLNSVILPNLRLPDAGTQSGLIREEWSAVPDSANQDVLWESVKRDVIAEEATSIEFYYYNGTEWVDYWGIDSTGPPSAISARLTLQFPSNGKTTLAPANLSLAIAMPHDPVVHSASSASAATSSTTSSSSSSTSSSSGSASQKSSSGGGNSGSTGGGQGGGNQGSGQSGGNSGGNFGGGQGSGGNQGSGGGNQGGNNQSGGSRGGGS